MVIWVVKLQREEYKISNIFWPKVNIIEGNHCILPITAINHVIHQPTAKNLKKWSKPCSGEVAKSAI